jgi:feruloyl esterase
MHPTLFFQSVFILLSCVTAISHFEQQCIAFQPESIIPGATRNVLQYVLANTTLTFPDNDASCNRKGQAVAVNVCRMALSIKTSEQSSINFEAWFPEQWSGRFLATGNGGIDGCEYSFSSIVLVLIIALTKSCVARHQVRRSCIHIL